jgi:hypothetical protein
MDNRDMYNPGRKTGGGGTGWMPDDEGPWYEVPGYKWSIGSGANNWGGGNYG